MSPGIDNETSPVAIDAVGGKVACNWTYFVRTLSIERRTVIARPVLSFRPFVSSTKGTRRFLISSADRATVLKGRSIEFIDPMYLFKKQGDERSRR